MPFRIDVDKSRLTCRVSGEKAADKEDIPTKQDFIALIESKAIKGVDSAIIDEAYGAFVKKGKLEGFLLAKGKPPMPPTDGVVKWLFDATLDEIHAGKVEKTGRIDYRVRRIFVEVDKEQLLGTWTPPALGIPGEDVFGQPLQPTSPKENNIIPGKNVRLSDDGTKCYSTIDGHVFASGLKVSVDRLFKVEGNVDFNTGNVRFPGDVEVSGNVGEKFIVEAKGNIVINGIVENAEIRATGNIVVKRGVIRNSRVIADGDLEAEFIQDSYAECGGNLIVNKSIVKSIINANQDITVTSMHGSNGIVGGAVNAGYDVSTYCIGTEIGVHTKVGAGKNNKLFLRYKKLVSDGLKAKANVKRIKKVLELMKAGSREKISNAGKIKQEKIEEVLAEQKSGLDSIIKELKEIKSQAEKFTTAKIKVFGTAHDGAEISICGIMTHLEQSVKKSVFFFDKEHNEVTYKPIKT